MTKKIIHLRRSTRDGRRKSTRLKPRKSRKRRLKSVRDTYDRDLGGYKFVSFHKDHKWHQTKRSKKQEKDEDILCKKLERSADTIDKEGYGMDDFFVSDNILEEDTTVEEDTDKLFQKAITHEWSDDEETDISDIDDYE